MRSWNPLISLAILVVLSISSASRAGEPPKTDFVGLEKQASRIIDTVLKNHLDPPARQEMILSGIRSVYREVQKPTPSGLAEAISKCETPAHFEDVLTKFWPADIKKSIVSSDTEKTFLEGMLTVIPRGGTLVREKDRAVNEQIMANRYVGIHVALRLDDDAKLPTFGEVFPGGPADRAGVKEGELIEKVDGTSIKGMKLAETIDRLRGAEGTEVAIDVRNPQTKQTRTLRLVRGALPRKTILGLTDRVLNLEKPPVVSEKSTDSDEKSNDPREVMKRVEAINRQIDEQVANKNSAGRDRFIDPNATSIGYVNLEQILASTPHELRKIAETLESAGAKALIIDLRFTQTADVHSVVLVADLLLEKGVIGRVRTVDHVATYEADSDALFQGWPIAVLVSSMTDGGAVWLAAALQDNHRAKIVGVPTLAHALVRSSIPVGDGAWSVFMVTGLLERGNGQALGEVIPRMMDNSGEILARPSGEGSFDSVGPKYAVIPDVYSSAKSMPTEYAAPTDSLSKARDLLTQQLAEPTKPEKKVPMPAADGK